MAIDAVTYVLMACISIVTRINAQIIDPVPAAGTRRHVPVLDGVATFYASPATIPIKTASTRRRARILGHAAAAPTKPFIIRRAATRTTAR
jgi:hypothetical protein